MVTGTFSGGYSGIDRGRYFSLVEGREIFFQCFLVLDGSERWSSARHFLKIFFTTATTVTQRTSNVLTLCSNISIDTRV